MIDNINIANYADDNTPFVFVFIYIYIYEYRTYKQIEQKITNCIG